MPIVKFIEHLLLLMLLLMMMMLRMVMRLTMDVIEMFTLEIKMLLLLLLRRLLEIRVCWQDASLGRTVSRPATTRMSRYIRMSTARNVQSGHLRTTTICSYSTTVAAAVPSPDMRIGIDANTTTTTTTTTTCTTPTTMANAISVRGGSHATSVYGLGGQEVWPVMRRACAGDSHA